MFEGMKGCVCAYEGMCHTIICDVVKDVWLLKL